MFILAVEWGISNFDLKQIQSNPDFSNLQRKRKLVRKIEGIKCSVLLREGKRLTVRVTGNPLYDLQYPILKG